MAELTLKATIREKVGSKAITHARKNGSVPAVVYGHGTDPKSLWIPYIDFNKAYQQAGESTIISLAVENGKTVNALIHDVQLDPMNNRFSHVDFLQVRMNETLETEVPLEFVGEAPAVREQGGILVRPVEEIRISCLPKDLPHSIQVDLSSIKDFDTHIQVKDLSMPSGVKVLTDSAIIIALVEAPRTDAQMAALDSKVDADVTKVAGVVKEESALAADAAKTK
jgi:large subunit ribosomal protein L25